MTQLSWSDIFTDASELDFAMLLAQWPGVVTGPLSPIGSSAFGDLYFQRPNGGIECLDVLEGGVHLVADSFESFQQMMNSMEWQEDKLLTSGVALLHDKAVLRGAGQFYAFAPHPAFTGQIDWNHVMPMDAAVWHSICSQALGVAP